MQRALVELDSRVCSHQREPGSVGIPVGLAQPLMQVTKLVACREPGNRTRRAAWVAVLPMSFSGTKSVTYNSSAVWWSFDAFVGDVFIRIFCYYSFVHQRSFMSQLSDLSWLLVPTFGGSATLLGSSSPGDVGFLEVLDALNPSLPVDCLPARSAFQQHVDLDMPLKTAPKKTCSSPWRRLASSWELRPPAVRTTRSTQGLECIFYSF